jgi:DNA-binding NtrC family response regulator
MSGRIRLLIVDDEERFLRTLTQRLALRDFDVTPVTSGQEALEAARRQEFDLALVDLKMPGMDGEAVLLELKRQHPQMEVIILTGHGSIDSAVQCTKAGSHSYLQKPCETEELLGALRDAYRKRVKNRLRLDEEQMAQLLHLSAGESPLGILRRLKRLEDGQEGEG